MIRRGSMRAVIVVAIAGLLGLAGCASSTVSLNTSEATARFDKETAQHYHGKVAPDDSEPGGQPVVPTEDGRGCHPISPQHWRCSAYVYMNEADGPNYDVAGTVVVTGSGVTVKAHGTPEG